MVMVDDGISTRPEADSEKETGQKKREACYGVIHTYRNDISDSNTANRSEQKLQQHETFCVRLSAALSKKKSTNDLWKQKVSKILLVILLHDKANKYEQIAPSQ